MLSITKSLPDKLQLELVKIIHYQLSNYQLIKASKINGY